MEDLGDLGGIVSASEMLYATSPVPVREIAIRTGLRETCLQKIKEGLDTYLDTDQTPEEIAQKTSLPIDVVAGVIRRFFEKCTQAYKHYQSQEYSSISGAAEAIGINRFYFEDFFWKKAVDSTDDDGKRCLKKLTGELSRL